MQQRLRDYVTIMLHHDLAQRRLSATEAHTCVMHVFILDQLLHVYILDHVSEAIHVYMCILSVCTWLVCER